MLLSFGSVHFYLAFLLAGGRGGGGGNSFLLPCQEFKGYRPHAFQASFFLENLRKPHKTAAFRKERGLARLRGGEGWLRDGSGAQIGETEGRSSRDAVGSLWGVLFSLVEREAKRNTATCLGGSPVFGTYPYVFAVCVCVCIGLADIVCPLL